MRAAFSAFGVGLLAVTCASAQPAGQQPAGGSLHHSVLQGAERFDPERLQSDLPEPDRARLREYARRRAAFRSGLDPPPPGSGADPTHDRRVALEREMVALVDRPGIEAAAAAAVAVVPPAPSGGPRSDDYAREIAWVEVWLQQHPDSPVAPLFYAYVAWQLRVGVEMNEDRALRERLARKYRTMLDRLRSRDDPIWRLLAEDLDREPRVTNAGSAHPREYLPAG